MATSSLGAVVNLPASAAFRVSAIRMVTVSAVIGRLEVTVRFCWDQTGPEFLSSAPAAVRYDAVTGPPLPGVAGGVGRPGDTDDRPGDDRPGDDRPGDDRPGDDGPPDGGAGWAMVAGGGAATGGPGRSWPPPRTARTVMPRMTTTAAAAAIGRLRR